MTLGVYGGFSLSAALVLIVARLFGRVSVVLATRVASTFALMTGAAWCALRMAAVA